VGVGAEGDAAVEEIVEAASPPEGEQPDEQ
jgi:hypothetical protein